MTEEAHLLNRLWNNAFPIITKETYWDAIARNYPDLFAEFSDWVNEYKVRNKWLELFNDSKVLGYVEIFLEAPKLHQLPIAMQLGIFIQYIQEIKHKAPFEPDISDMEGFAQDVEAWFKAESILRNYPHFSD